MEEKHLQLKNRKTYKFNSCICQGGWFYIRRTKKGKAIKDKVKLRDALESISKKFRLIDVTIKIYDSIFFLFFMMKPTIKPIDIIEAIQEKIFELAKWDKKYLYEGVYDLQEEYVKEYMNKLGFDYNNG